MLSCDWKCPRLVYAPLAPGLSRDRCGIPDRHAKIGELTVERDFSCAASNAEPRRRPGDDRAERGDEHPAQVPVAGHQPLVGVLHAARSGWCFATGRMARAAGARARRRLLVAFRRAEVTDHDFAVFGQRTPQCREPSPQDTVACNANILTICAPAGTAADINHPAAALLLSHADRTVLKKGSPETGVGGFEAGWFGGQKRGG